MKSLLTLILLASVFTLNAKAQPLPLYEQPIKMPSVLWKDGYGQTLNFDNFKGDVIFLNFWATWCTPCAMEMPAFDFLQKRYKAGDFKVIAINVGQESPQKIQRFYQEHNLTNLDIYLDETGEILNLFGAKTLPTTFVINRNGEIIAGKVGLANWMSNDMMRFIENQLRQENPYARPFQKPSVKVNDISDMLRPAVRF